MQDSFITPVLPQDLTAQKPKDEKEEEEEEEEDEKEEFVKELVPV